MGLATNDDYKQLFYDLGIRTKDFEANNSLEAKSIEITGIGGMSSIKKGAINQFGEDTFQETANNTGIEINNSSSATTSGSISIIGIGGSLSIDEIVDIENNTDIEEISKASFLQGVKINTAEINSNNALFISGEAGKPIAGNDNSGTSINQSRLTSAATVATDHSLDNRIEGKAYSGTNNNYGLSIKATDIVSTNQDLDLSGVGGLKASGDNNFGIYIGESSSVAVGSRSKPSLLNIFGAGGNGTNLTGGILTENTSYEIEGSIKMFGESQGAGGFGNASVEFIENIDITVSDDAFIIGGNDININDTNINTGGTSTINAMGNINISKTNITSGKDTNILAGGSIDINETTISSGQDTILEDNTDNATDEANESSAKKQQKDEANTIVGSSTKLSVKAIQESHDKSEKINSDFVASELGLTRQAPLSIQEIQQMLTSGQQIMNTSR